MIRHHGRRFHLALALRDSGAIRSSDSESSFDFNLRTIHSPRAGPVTQEMVDEAAYCMYRILVAQKLAADAIVGIPPAGEPFCQALAKISRIPCVTLETWHESGRRHITGLKGKALLVIKQALLIDDFVIGSDWKREAIRVLRDAHIIVSDVLVLVDCEHGEREELARMGCRLHSVFTVTELRTLYNLDQSVKNHALEKKGGDSHSNGT